MMNMRKKSVLRRAHRMYQGSAVRQKDAMAAGCRRRKASRQRLVKSAQKKMAPPERMMAAGTLVRTARARKKPERRRGRQGVRGKIGRCVVSGGARTAGGGTIASGGMAAEGSVVAAGVRECA